MTLLGKCIVLGLKLFHRKGAALPGLIIEKIYPRYLNNMLDQLPRGVIVITGTNGKTTTTKIVVALLEAAGLRVLTNDMGSNFVRGVIASCVRHANLAGKLSYDIAVFEQDEAHAVLFAKRYQPVGVVALNVMRDQMDRFGEIDSTAKLIGRLAEQAKSWVVLNANDKRIAALARQQPKDSVTWFGHSKDLEALFVDDDQLYAAKPVFYEAAKPDVELQKIGSEYLVLALEGKRYKVPTLLDGTHNAINAVAAVATFLAAVPAKPVSTALKRLQTVQPAFGRGEAVHLKNGNELRLQLVKNPAGFRHALRMLGKQQFEAAGIVINDDFADGRDVSWLWDVDFRALGGQVSRVLCGGTRAAEMAVRLKYDEVKADAVIADLDTFLLEMMSAGGRSIVFCTYTAMLAIRKRLKRQDKSLHKEGL